MDKFDINSFFVGYLNFCYYYKDISKPNEVESIENSKKNKIFISTIEHGAVNLNHFKFERLPFFNRGLKSDSLLTIFYQISENKYLCLHNNNIYSMEGHDFCSNLVPLKEIVPKIDFELRNKISYDDAKKIFKGLFKKNNFFTFDKRYSINHFYLGNLIVCMGYTDKNQYHDLNVIPRIILESNPIISALQVGSSILEDDEEYDYIKYPSIFLKIDNNLFYNINNYQNYVLERSCNRLDNNIEIELPLSKSFKLNDIKYPEKISISKVLKLQKRIK